MSRLFRNYLSYYIGALASWRAPKPFSTWSVKIFAWWYRIDTSLAEKNIAEYPSIGDFFVRDLKPGARTIGDGVVSPVDGRVRDYGSIEEGVLPQVKGVAYTVEAFLGDAELARRFADGAFVNLYLAPPDYHHVHSPCEGTVVSSIYIPGDLRPVNDPSLRRNAGLFVTNERVVTLIETAHGLVAVVMVGALNVGKMRLAYDTFLADLYPSYGSGEVVRRHYSGGISLKKGARIGTFMMGSSVVILFESNMKGAVDRLLPGRGSKLVYGQTIISTA